MGLAIGDRKRRSVRSRRQILEVTVTDVIQTTCDRIQAFTWRDLLQRAEGSMLERVENGEDSYKFILVV